MYDFLSRYSFDLSVTVLQRKYFLESDVWKIYFLESGVCTSFIWKDEKEITVIYAVYPSAETPPMSPR